MIEQTKARERHCDREFLQLFMEGELSLDDELTFLVHLWMTADHAGILSEVQRRPFVQNGAEDPRRTGVLIAAIT